MCDKQCKTCECKKPKGKSWGTAKKTREFRNTPYETMRITYFPIEKQKEWAAVKPYDKDANKGLATLAPQRTESAFKDTIRGDG